MNFKGFFLVIAVASALFLSSCNGSGTPPLSKKEMAGVLIDLHVAQSMFNRQQSVPNANLDHNKYYKAILQKHGISEAEFDSAVSWYARNAGEYKLVYKIVVDTLTARAERGE